MNKLLLIFPLISLLSACLHVTDHQGKAVPIVIETAQPAIIVDVREQVNISPNTPVYVCTLKPFIDTYRSEHIHRGTAKLAVQKQCLAKNNEMFCQEKDIQCSEYK